MTPTQALEELVKASVGLSDADLDRAYAWGEYSDEGLRFALITAHHELRDLTMALGARRAKEKPLTRAHRLLAQFHEAYRDLTGVLAAVGEAEVDRDPGGGQWTLRQIIDHMLETEAAFLTSIARARDAAPDAPKVVPLDPSGDRRAALDALSESHIRIVRECSGLSDEQLELPSTFWESVTFPVRFRIRRFEEHVRQHTIQIEKTLAMLGHAPTEAERFVRLLHVAVAAIENASLGGWSAPDLTEPAADRIAALAAEVRAAVAA